jgi:hypothetical protein
MVRIGLHCGKRIVWRGLGLREVVIEARAKGVTDRLRRAAR